MPKTKPKSFAEQEKLEHLEACAKITHLLTSELDLDTLLLTIMKTAKRMMKADGCSLLLLDETRRYLNFHVALSRVGEKVKTIGRIPVGQGIAGAVAKTGRTAVVADAYKSKRFDPEFDQQTGFKTGSIMCIPLKSRGKILGVCEVILKKGNPRVYTRADVPKFRVLCEGASLAIQNALAVKGMIEQQQWERDIASAHTVQQGFLPETPPEHPKFQFSARMIPARVVGGDFYDFIRMDEDRVAVILGDVSGKGMPAALHMARLMSDFRYCTLTNPDDPASVLYRVNNILCERNRTGMFTTAIYILLNLKRRTMQMVNCGHPPAILGRPGKPVDILQDAVGVPLGILPNFIFPVVGKKLVSGSRVFLHTDGVPETCGEKNIPFGFKRLYSMVQNEKGTSLDLLCHVEQKLRNYIGKTPQRDDWTFLTFRVL